MNKFTDTKEIERKFKVTKKQAEGFNALCDEFNKKLLEGTGVVAVPFWFVDQYNEMLRLNQALTDQVTRMAKVIDVSAKSTDFIVQPSQNIITGINEPYLPGITGPRIGDEHLDTDRIFLPNIKG